MREIVDALLDVWYDHAPNYTCSEANLLALLILSHATDGAVQAEKFLDAHARGDDDDDEHYSRRTA